MNIKLFPSHLSANYSTFMLKRLAYVAGGPESGPAAGPAKGPAERADAKRETAKKLAALKESISKDPDNVKKIAAAIDMSAQEDEVKQAVLRYDLSKFSKRLPAAQEAIISKIKDAIRDGAIKMDDIVFYGGTDYKPFNLKRVLRQTKDWHNKKIQAFQEMKALGDRLHPQSIKDRIQSALNGFGTGEIDLYITAKERGTTKSEVIKTHAEAFLAEDGLFNIALAYQRAKHAHQELGGGKPFDVSKQEVYLDVGKINMDPATRKSGIWALGEIKPEPQEEPKVEEPKPEEPKQEEPKREEPKVEPKPEPEPKVEPPKPEPKSEPEVLPTGPDPEKEWVEGMISKDYKIFVQAYQNMTSRNDYNGLGKEQNVFMRDPIMDIKTPALHEVAMGYGVEHGKERDTTKQINRFKVRGVYLKETGIDAERIFLRELENDLRAYYKKLVKENGIKFNKPNPKEQAERDAFTKKFEKYFEARLQEFEAKASTDQKGKTLHNAMYSGSLFSVTEDAIWSTLVDVRRGPDVGGKPQFEYYIRGAKRTDRADVLSYMKQVALQQYDLDHKFIVLGEKKLNTPTPSSVEATPVGEPGLQEAPNPLDDRDLDDETKDEEYKKLDAEAAKLNDVARKGTKSLINDSPKKKPSWEAYLNAEKKILAFVEAKKEAPYYTSLLHVAQAEAKLGKLTDAKAHLEEVIAFFISHPTAEKAEKKKNLAMQLSAAILEYEAKK